ncbi:hypothetical protein Tdes44962_MAKER04854 [Teratosphaeria destructans]|uniref:Uncharacterized protein n=1 Tax=Teratosphaeria destructans TaxID=418781 RepID=A0A9W7SL59_9PEZI|nr:hypothetical protein Tdes44962_MAKER04854 [Teratosphaeria destructans]
MTVRQKYLTARLKVLCLQDASVSSMKFNVHALRQDTHLHLPHVGRRETPTSPRPETAGAPDHHGGNEDVWSNYTSDEGDDVLGGK